MKINENELFNTSYGLFCITIYIIASIFIPQKLQLSLQVMLEIENKEKGNVKKTNIIPQFQLAYLSIEINLHCLFLPNIL